jgi:hypothetical protein
MDVFPAGDVDQVYLCMISIGASYIDLTVTLFVLFINTSVPQLACVLAEAIRAVVWVLLTFASVDVGDRPPRVHTRSC